MDVGPPLSPGSDRDPVGCPGPLEIISSPSSLSVPLFIDLEQRNNFPCGSSLGLFLCLQSH